MTEGAPRPPRAQVSTSPQARAWQPSPPAARSWPPTTTTGAAWAPLPVTAPAEVPSTLGKPSPTTRVSPKQTRDTGGLASSSGSPLSRSWPQCWSPQSSECAFLGTRRVGGKWKQLLTSCSPPARSLPRPPPARSHVTWLGKLWGSSSPAASLAKPTAGPRPE